MPEYQVFARKYRPQRFCEILGQDAMVKTLKNAIKSKRLAQAYLFSGSRGTGKTTTARILAKALNCLHLGEDLEPCNACSSCKEITEGNSLYVLEIDGASHRGIEKIREINETVNYASSGECKIYIIDEVHMLTKEAFNALLKTLEEPPPKVKFFFATTEPHKVPSTIISRCQRFALNRISNEVIVKKLHNIVADVGTVVDDEALHMIAQLAEGGLRDAESLLDQVLSFHEGSVDAQAVATVLGVMVQDIYFELDRAGKEGELSKAFDIAHQVFAGGKNIDHFVEGLVEHFRNLLLVIVSDGAEVPFLTLSESERKKYIASAKLYRKEQCMEVLDFLLEAQQQIRFAPSVRIALEAILLRVIRSHRRIPIEIIVKKLAELQEVAYAPAGENQSSLFVEKQQFPQQAHLTQISHTSSSENERDGLPKMGESRSDSPRECEKSELSELPQAVVVKNETEMKKNQNRYDTLLQFAAVELEGTVQKKR